MQLSYPNGIDDGYLIEDKKNNKYIFTAAGYLYRIKDSNNNTMTLSYQGTKLKTIIDGANRKTTLDILDNGYLVGITDSSGRKTTVGYSGIQLSKITYPDGNLSSITYDSNDNLTEAKNYDGYKVRYEYSKGVDQKVTKTYEVFNDETAGNSLAITYGHNTTSFKDKQGREEVYKFNNWGNTSSIVDLTTGSGTYYKYGEIKNVNKLEVNSKLQNTVTNHLFNHNVETNDTQWKYNYDKDPKGTGGISTEDKYLGENSIKITKDNKVGLFYFNQTLALELGKTYTFSAYVKSKVVSSTSQGALLFVNYSNKEGIIQTMRSNYISGSADWQRISVTFTIPADATSNVAYVRGGIEEGTGTAYFDCFQVEEGVTANRYNLVENANFKTQNNELSSAYWSETSADTTNKVYKSQDTTYPIVLDKEKTVYMMTGYSSKKKNVYQSISISGKKGDIFVASGWARGESVPITDKTERLFGMDIGFQKADGSYEWHVIPFNEDVDGWQYVSDVVVAGSDYIGVRIYGLYYNNVNNVYFDNFQLYKEEFGTSYEYDKDGNLLSTKEVAQKNSTFEYYENNDLMKAIDPKGNNYTYSYDGNHNIKKATTAENINYYFDYDSYGNPIKAKVDDGKYYIKSEATYTTDGNYIRSITNEIGNKTIYNYDGEAPGQESTGAIVKGNLTSITDANNKSTFYKYDNNTDALTSVNKTVDGKEIANLYTYQNDRLKTINHNGFNYTFNYDKAGNNTEVLVGNQKLITNNFNLLSGNVESSIYGNGNTVTYEYDNLDRVVGKKFNGDTQNRYTYEYDANGNLARSRDTINGTYLKYLYDFSDRLSEITDSNKNNFKINYDLNNNVSDFEEEYNTGNSKFKTSYTYDKDNKQKEINYTTDGKANKIAFGYDSLGRLSTSSITVGASGIHNTSIAYVVGGDLRDTNLIKSYTNGSKKIDYTYDKLNNIKTIVSNGKTITFTYNELNELIREDNGVLNKSIVYTYDVGGNILDKKEYAYTTGTLGSVVSTKSYTYGDTNWKDKLTAYDGKAITYDAIGNPLTYDGNTYSWEAGRRLKGITGNNNNISYKYNDSGIRTEKIVNGVKTSYTLSGDEVILETTGNEKIHYTYDSSNNLVSMNISGSSDSTINGEYYYIKNIQGDIIGLVDKTGKEVVTYTYDTWGNLISIEGTLKDTVGVKNPYRYRGYRYDTEIGLYYLNARYYNPELGRFINADGYVGESGTLLSANMFVYCINNPANLYDPTGKFFALPWLAQVAAAVVTTVIEVIAVAVVSIAIKKIAKVIAKEIVVYAANQYYKSTDSTEESENNGPYSNLEDSRSVGEGKDFTPTQKKKIINSNKKRNGGEVKSDEPMDPYPNLVKPSKSTKGVTPPANEWQIDHIIPKSKGGTNSYKNARVISRYQNRLKWDN